MLLLAAHVPAETRYEELARVVKRNTGFAHMTRGVSMYTLIALRSTIRGCVPTP